MVSAEEPNVSTPLTIWVRSLSWTDFMSFLIAHIWKRASSAAQHIEWVSEDKRGTSWQTGQRGKQNTATSSPVSQKMTQATDWQVQVMFFHRENVKKKKKLWLVSISGWHNETVSERRGFRAAAWGEAHIRCELWSGSWRTRPVMWTGSPRTPSCGTRCSWGPSSGGGVCRAREERGTTWRRTHCAAGSEPKH